MSPLKAITIILCALLIATGCSRRVSSSTKNADRVSAGADSTLQTDDAEPECDPNYSGCVPIASDVDCAGGRGDGPEYVKGPITVIGRDVYLLDRNKDGIACE